ncbi:MAG: hypothetical protein EZS28_019977 [Streblomastix strix]|uniref:Uncharacterized protein n=1 Tax=Streblomastix strix TaxID=222440 RepID=A0A5J4VPD0_9EUKA|nr:MAG: hypothetical protein EZS28_019977 [Streblomastix strix]
MQNGKRNRAVVAVAVNKYRKIGQTKDKSQLNESMKMKTAQGMMDATDRQRNKNRSNLIEKLFPKAIIISTTTISNAKGSRSKQNHCTKTFRAKESHLTRTFQLEWSVKLKYKLQSHMPITQHISHNHFITPSITFTHIVRNRNYIEFNFT